MKQRKIIPAPILMAIAILCVTAFQLYWLAENYEREKNTLRIKSEAAFRESIMQLQVSKLASHDTSRQVKDSTHHNLNIIMNAGEPKPGDDDMPKEAMVTSINIVQNFKDTFQKEQLRNQMVSMYINKDMLPAEKDSIRLNGSMFPEPHEGGNRIFKLLSGVLSIQDSLRLSEIDSAYKKTMQREKFTVPFTIVKSMKTGKPSSAEVIIGFDKPVSYQLVLGNTVPFLVRQILQPIIFSVLLLLITIFAFVMMYKSLQRQKRQAEEKNEFVSNITHELKTPIATVGVAIEALKNFNAIDDPERTAEYLDISQNELSRLSLLVDKVLKLSMFESKEVELKFEQVTIAAIVNEVVASLKLQLQKLQASVVVNASGNTTVLGDKMHLVSVIFNLLDNALKYCNETPIVKIEVVEEAASINLTITDNGVGIAPEYHKKVFEKFFRVPHGDTHNAKGYGLGLSFVAQVIQKHNGTISMESSTGKGTSIKITLPKVEG